MLTSARLVWLAGLTQAVMIAAGAYVARPGSPTGRPLFIALAGVAISAAVTYAASHRVKAAVAREAKERAKSMTG